MTKEQSLNAEAFERALDECDPPLRWKDRLNITKAVLNITQYYERGVTYVAPEES